MISTATSGPRNGYKGKGEIRLYTSSLSFPILALPPIPVKPSPTPPEKRWNRFYPPTPTPPSLIPSLWQTQLLPTPKVKNQPPLQSKSQKCSPNILGLLRFPLSGVSGILTLSPVEQAQGRCRTAGFSLALGGLPGADIVDWASFSLPSPQGTHLLPSGLKMYLGNLKG